MAQEIMVAGAIYEDVPSVRLPDSNGVFHPFTDTSDTTAVAADVAQGKTFHLADGSAATGTAAGATLVTKSITANGTYSAEDDDADGYSEVTVNVSGGGGGGGGVDPKDVNFIDFDGTVLHAYTAAEFAALTALPDNPTHDGLVAQGWNWTLSDAQSYVASCGPLTIGQMYVTASGDTEIDVSMPEGRLEPYLNLAPNGTVTIDWGDGSSTDTLTGTSLTTRDGIQHSYAAAGDYTITVHVVSGTVALYGTSTYTLLYKNATANQNRVYSNCVRAVRIGTSASIGDYAFSYCHSLSSVTIPSGVNSIGDYAFVNCYSLLSASVPSGVTSINNHAFDNCRNLSSVAIPSSVTTIGDYAFGICYGLSLMAIPDSVTTIGANAFASCYSLPSVSVPSGVNSIGAGVFASCVILSSVTIPSSVTTIGANAFDYCNSLPSVAIPDSVTSIGDYAFRQCYSLPSVAIPSGVTSIGNYAFTACHGLSEIHFLPTTPPTVSNRNAWNSLPTDCTIYVPTGSLSAYTSAANYPSSSTYTYVGE